MEIAGVGGVVVEGPGNLGEGYRAVSWIWTTTPTILAGDDIMTNPHMHSALRVEWAKSRARAERWREELILLSEEMRRSLAFVRYRASWWRQLGSSQTHANPGVLEGLRAYAFEQASHQDILAAQWLENWTPLVAKAKESPFGHEVVSLVSESMPLSSLNTVVMLEIKDDDGMVME